MGVQLASSSQRTGGGSVRGKWTDQLSRDDDARHATPARRHTSMSFAVPLTVGSLTVDAGDAPARRSKRAAATRRGGWVTGGAIGRAPAVQRSVRMLGVPRPPSPRVTRPVVAGRRSLIRCAAGDDDDKVPEGTEGDGLSSSFMEELKRRQNMEMNADELGRENAKSTADAKWGADDGLGAAPRFAKDDGARGVETEQLKRSRALQNEGLEGFPTRAGELLKLGFTSFISFGPLITVLSVVFVGTYLFLGSDFIHGGDSYGGPPPYVPPEVLLAEPTVDRMVPMNDPIPYGQ